MILSRSIAAALAAIPSAAGISLAPIGLMMSDGTAHACPNEAVVPDEMTGDAADHRSFYASRRLGWAGRQTDKIITMKYIGRLRALHEFMILLCVQIRFAMVLDRSWSLLRA